MSLARALVNNPSILLADEPTGNLDPGISREIMYLLDEINQRGTTVIVATHEKSLVDEMEKRVISLDYGRIIHDVQKGNYTNEV